MRIAAFPPGLLDLLEAAREGRALSEAADALVCVVDITDLYGTNQQSVQQATNNLAAGENAFLTVPTGEIWRVVAGSVNAQTGVGSTATDVSIYLKPPDIAGALLHVSDPTFDLAASQVGIAGIRMSMPLVLRSGTVIGVYAGTITGTPAANLVLLIQRLKA